MINRKELKKRAKKVLKIHYGFLIIACMISGILANEFSDTFTLLSAENEIGVQEDSNAVLPSQLTASQVLKDIVEDNLEEGAKTAETIEKKEISESHDPVLGRTRGVLASVINSVSSGSIFVSIAAAINSMVGSESIAVLIMILGGLFLLFLAWFYIQNVFCVILRRIFLEARIYEKVPFERYMFLSHVKKWTKASFTMFVTSMYQTLWMFTIVGFVIKHYSYLMVPYIVAENPDIGANQAITLSRKMMNGHKWECFKISLTFLGWTLLSSMTFGLSAIFFSNPYKMCTYAELYAVLRKEAKLKNIKDADRMNDVYLFELPNKEELEKAYPEYKDRYVQEPELQGFAGFFANWFGILFKEGKKEKEYQEKMRLYQRYRAVSNVLDAKQYPKRLFSIAEEQKRTLVTGLDPLRNYTIWSLILMFFIFSGIGWLWEVSLHLITDGVFVNRGAMHGPWLPIYGSGGLLILILLKKFRSKPLLNFLCILIVCGILEYSTSYIMEMNTGLKWWDYSGYFLNLNGRICAEGLMVFGIGGMGFIYILAPVFDNLIRKIKPAVTKIVCIFFVIVFSIDMVYSHFYPNTGEGITDYEK